MRLQPMVCVAAAVTDDDVAADDGDCGGSVAQAQTIEALLLEARPIQAQAIVTPLAALGRL